MQETPHGREAPRAKAIPPRQADLTALFAGLREMHCTSVVGVSNFGKSALLRAMTDPQIQRRYLGEDAWIYDTTTGALYYDADGLGGVDAVQVAVLGTTTHPGLVYSDVQIIG